MLQWFCGLIVYCRVLCDTMCSETNDTAALPLFIHLFSGLVKCTINCEIQYSGNQCIHQSTAEQLFVDHSNKINTVNFGRNSSVLSNCSLLRIMGLRGVCMIICSSEVKPRSMTRDISLGINMKDHLQLDRWAFRWPNFHSIQISMLD